MQLPAIVVSVFAGWFGGANGPEPLHDAARSGNIVHAHLALIRCPDAVNTPERFTKARSTTPVHLAAYWNNAGVLEFLLAHGGKADDPGQSGETPLQHAASRGSTATAEVLLKRGVSLDIFSAVALDKWNEVQSCFHLARKVGMQTRLANASSHLGWGTRPLLNWAIHGGHYRMVELLIRNGAEVNPYADARETLNWTPLHATISAKRPDIAELLLRNGAKIDAQNYNGYTALHLAVGYNDVASTRMLLEHGARVDTSADWYLPRASAPNGDPRTFSTPLHTAAKNESPKLVALLLAHGASLQARDAENRTPLDVAATVPDVWDRGTGWYKPGKLTPARALCVVILIRASAARR